MNSAKLTSAHFYSWKAGLKTGMYYLRTKAAVDALAGLGIDMEKTKNSMRESEVKTTPSEVSKPVSVTPNGMTSEELSKAAEEVLSGVACSLDNPDECDMCGS